MAARVHDSVLQTLALIQRHADDPAVASLARRPRAGHRGWLYDRPLGDDGTSIVAALSAAAADVEDRYGVRVELASSGDAAVATELVLAAREAMANAAKFAGVEEVDVYAEVTEDELAVFVRDRGAGFDRASVPADRRGLVDIDRTPSRAGRWPRVDPPRRRARGRRSSCGSRGALREHTRRPRRRPRALPREGQVGLGDAVDIVGEAGTVADAIPLIKEVDPDVVLLDVHLPDGSGDAIINAVAPERPGVASSRSRSRMPRRT